MKQTIFFLCAAMCLVSCDPAKRAARRGEYKNLPEITISANDNKNIYRSSAPILWDITHTRVALSFDWIEKTADGKAWIDVHPYFYPQDTLALDAKGMNIETVAQIVNGKTEKVAYTYADNKLVIRLGKQHEPADAIRLYIAYKAMPYKVASGGSAAITDDRGLYFINTDGAIPSKPRQIWTQGETESDSHWMPTIDKPNERFTVQVELTVPDTMQTLGNGMKVASENAGKNLRTDTWLMEQRIQAYAVMFAIGKFAVVKDKWKDKAVSYYVEHEYAPYARKMFSNTPEMMDFFSEITGVPYPWPKYSQIVVRDYVSGAMENTSASLFGEFMNQNFREIADGGHEDIVSHELFHQWFGDYVTMESWSNLTLSESFANYGEQLWRRYKYGKESADKLAYEDWQKYINSKTYAPTLVRFHYSDKEDMFDRISYEKGGGILRYLHSLVGDEAFYKAMNIYLTRHALSSAEATDWRKAVEEATGQDWNWFFNQFYYRGGHPQLDVQYAYDDKQQQATVTITQMPIDSNYNYQLPLKTAIVYGSEQTTVDWNITKKKEEYKFAYKNGLRPLVIPDIAHTLPGTIKQTRTPAEWLQQYQVTDDHISKRMAIFEAFKAISDETSKMLIEKALTDKSALIRAYTVNNVYQLKAETYAQRWRPTIEHLATDDPSANVRAAAFDVLGKWKMTSLKKEMIAATGDSSYNVAGSALNALYQADKDTAYHFARIALAGQPRGELRDAGESIMAKKGSAADIAYFESNAAHVYGNRKLSFVTIMAAYLSVVNDMAVFDKGISMMADLAKKESIKSYRNYITLALINLGDNFKKKGLENDIKRNKIKKYAEELLQAETNDENRARYKIAIEEVFGDK